MGAAVSSGAAGEEGAIVETYRCHACGCNWRQAASRETNSCPQCEGDFVERISVGVASRPTINMESIQQAMEQFEQSGGNMSAMSMHEMLMNIAQFRAQAMGMTALGSGDEDADLREALARSVQESESKPSLPPPASLKAIGTLRSNKYSRVLHGKDENCVICTEAYQLGEDVTKMPCQHLFHKACLTPWLQNTNSCPVCRHQLETDDVDYEAKRTTPSSTPMGTPQRVAPAPAAPAASSVVRRAEGEVGGAGRQSRFVVQSSSSSGDDDDDDDDDDAEGSVRAGRRDLDVGGDGEGEDDGEGAEGSAASAISRWARRKASESSSSSSAAARRAGSSGGAQQQQRRQQQETASSSSRAGGDRTGGASGVGRGGASRRSGATTGRVTTPAPPPQPRASPSGSWPRGVGIVGGGATSASRGGVGGGSRPGSFRGGAPSSSLSSTSGTNGRASNSAAASVAGGVSSTTAAASGALAGTRRAGSGTGGGAAASASRRG